MPVEIRPFRRDDREQLAALVNAHVAAVVPGLALPVNTVMGQLEREPGEPLVDPWVTERRMLVAVAREAVVGAALLLRYADEPRVAAVYRGAAEARWLVARPDQPDTADALIAACVRVMHAWGADPIYADGTLPALATYGVPDCWPHVRAAYRRAGFTPAGNTEVVLLADVGALPRVHDYPLGDVTLARTVGLCGTRLSAVRDGAAIGYIEIDTDVTAGGTRSRLAGWADIGNLHVSADVRRRGLGTWLLAHAAHWLRLGHVDRLIAYASPDRADELGFLAATGFVELTRTDRDWRLDPAAATQADTTAV